MLTLNSYLGDASTPSACQPSCLARRNPPPRTGQLTAQLRDQTGQRQHEAIHVVAVRN